VRRPDPRARPGGRQITGCVSEMAGAYVLVRCDDPEDQRMLAGGLAGKHVAFWAESGWRAWDSSFFWRLVPLCRCESPILGEPVTDPEDPLGREFCRDDCLDSAAESSHGAFAARERD
jgi:hypothetical protein